MKDQPLINSSQVKTIFFNHQVDFMSDLRDRIEDLKVITKHALLNPDQRMKSVQVMNQGLKNITEKFKKDRERTIREIGMSITENQIQTNFFFDTYEQKIQELNMRLVRGEELVQEAEQLKRRRQDQYFTTNYKLLRKIREMRTINRNIQSRKLCLNEINKMVENLIKIKEKREDKSETHLSNLAKYKRQNVGFRKFKELAKMSQFRPYKSLDKYAPNSTEIKEKKSYLAFIFKSEFCKEYFQIALREKIGKLREKNAQKARKNYLYEMAMEEKNRSRVLKSLKDDQLINFEQKIMKVEIQAQIFNKNLEQRLLSAKVNKRSYEWPGDYEKKDQQELHEKRKVGSENGDEKNESQERTACTLQKVIK